MMEEQTKVESEHVIKDLHTFQSAIGQAQLNGIPYVEVDEKVFNYYTKGMGKSFTYGNPGIRVYLHGAREEVEEFEARVSF